MMAEDDWDGPEAAVRAAGIIDEALEQVRAATPAETLLYGEDLDGDLPPVDYFVQELGLVAGGGAPHMIAGYGFSGKTMAVQAMALAFASGTGLWGFWKVAQRNVVHVDMEQGRNLTQRRYKRLAKALGLDLKALGKAIAVSVMPRLSLTEAHRAEWKALMVGRGLLIIDSFKASTAGQDENSSEARIPLDMLGSLSEETGCRALVIHHSRKTQEGVPSGTQSVRGSSAIFDACDCVYVFSSAKGEPIKVECVKARTHGEQIEDSALRIEDVAEGENKKWGVRVQLMGVESVVEAQEARIQAVTDRETGKNAERMRKFITDHPGCGAKDVRDFLSLNGQRYARAREFLGEALEIRMDGKVQQHFMRGASL